MAKKELDKLSRDMIECEKAGYGCHYGAWYAATHEPTVIIKPTELPEGWKKCEHCGKPFKPHRTDQRFCEATCQREDYYEKNREELCRKKWMYQKRRKERQNESCT